MKPQLFHQFAGHRAQRFFVRIKKGNPSNAIASMQKAWKSLVPDAPFKYSFLDEDLDNFYTSEKRWSGIVGWAGGISILLACLGLFGLVSLAVVNRTKEVGIRKVLGASVSQVWLLLSKDFLKLILLSLLLAFPVSWWFMNEWLQSFAYRISITPPVFAIAGISVVVITLITISFQSIKAAIANPVQSLRTE